MNGRNYSLLFGLPGHPWWRFWDPLSGILGGFIFGCILVCPGAAFFAWVAVHGLLEWGGR